MDISQNFDAIPPIAKEIRLCLEAGAITAAVTMCFILIDSLAHYSRPHENRSTRKDFKYWIDKYLKSQPAPQYQYNSDDIYAARCALLHSFSSETDAHNSNKDLVRFIYGNGGPHIFQPETNKTLAAISVPLFFSDLIDATDRFMQECEENPELLKKVGSRLEGMLKPNKLSP